MAGGWVHNLRDGFAGMGKGLWAFVSNPRQWPEKSAEWKQKRQDRAEQLRLNRQIRLQFMEAFNKSATRQMTVEVNDEMRKYKNRNGGVIGALLRGYEIYSTLNIPARIGGAVAFFQAARALLAPVMGIWGVVVPIVAFIGARAALLHRDASNREQEKFLRDKGLIPPCTFDVKDGAVSVQGVAIADGTPFGFPLLHAKAPRCLMSQYDAAARKLGRPVTVHAAVYEASIHMREKFAPLSKEFSGDRLAFAAVQTLLFPDMPAAAIAAEAAAAEEPYARAAVMAIEAFCPEKKGDGGLNALKGRVTANDLRYLVHLMENGFSFGADAARTAADMLKDGRFNGLSFREIADVALLPKELSSSFRHVWEDRDCRKIFSYQQVLDIVTNAAGWGGVALSIAQNDYARKLANKDIIELAQPENEHWAKAYHRLRTESADVAGLSHADLRAAVQQFGLLAPEALARQATATGLARKAPL